MLRTIEAREVMDERRPDLTLLAARTVAVAISSYVAQAGGGLLAMWAWDERPPLEWVFASTARSAALLALALGWMQLRAPGRSPRRVALEALAASLAIEAVGWALSFGPRLLDTGPFAATLDELPAYLWAVVWSLSTSGGIVGLALGLVLAVARRGRWSEGLCLAAPPTAGQLAGLYLDVWWSGPGQVMPFFVGWSVLAAVLTAVGLPLAARLAERAVERARAD